jgi:hypothetical protein
MRWIKLIAISVFVFLIIECEKDKNYFNPLILGNWRLIEIFGVKDDNTLGWIVIYNSHIQTIEFGSNGEYKLATDGNITCKGKYIFESDSTIKLKPNNCMPLMKSVETIYKLTPDTLIISNKSSSISSFNLRRDKYIRND